MLKFNSSTNKNNRNGKTGIQVHLKLGISNQNRIWKLFLRRNDHICIFLFKAFVLSKPIFLPIQYNNKLFLQVKKKEINYK
jgi:hypothetical protein